MNSVITQEQADSTPEGGTKQFQFHLFSFHFEEVIFANIWRTLAVFGGVPLVLWLIPKLAMDNVVMWPPLIQSSLISNCQKIGESAAYCIERYNTPLHLADIATLAKIVPAVFHRIDLIFGLALFIFALIALAIALIARQVRYTFPYLLENGRLQVDSGDVQGAYTAFLDSYQWRCQRRRRLVVIGLVLFIVIFAAFVLPFFPVLSAIITDESGMYTYQGLFLARLIFWFPLPFLLWAYLVGAGIWLIYVTATAISGLTPRFRLHIQPNHPDHSGGLRPLGQLTFAMAMPILALMLMFVLLLFTPLLPEVLLENTDVLGRYYLDQAGGNAYYLQDIITDFSANIRAVSWVILLALVLLMILLFVGPLLDISVYMREQRRDYAERYNREINRLNALVWPEHAGEASGAAPGRDALEAAKKKLDFLQTQHPDVIHYPVWPFDLGIRAWFITSLIIPVGSLVLNIYQVFS